ncbi:hypothetical protein ABBQ32_007505 [Trebouxia sp. C0010 RCD-2024]
MFGVRLPAKRFTLLLLEEEEDYVADFLASCTWPTAVPGNVQQARSIPGSLRLCSRSLFFDPDDVRIPIVRIPFLSIQQLEGVSKSSLSLATTQVIKMKANTADAPYVVQKGALTHWQFSLTYAAVDQFLVMAHEQLAASRLPYADRKEALQIGARQRASEAVFDNSRLVEFSEQIQYDAPAVQLTPLVQEGGRLVVTDQRLYFQPLHNVAGGNPVRSHPLAALAAVAHRHSSLRPVGLEMFFIEGGGGPQWGAPSAFFAFPNTVEANKAAQAILAQPCLGEALPGGKSASAAAGSILEAGGGWLAKVTGGWQAGHISNLDYLLYCNLAAGRSFNDLTQWPVFPWVLCDYTSQTLDLNSPASFRDLSKPIGALNPHRLEAYKFRFREMPRDEGADPPFLYGTHYSCPGYVMYWLVRAAPAHLLRLQNGRFDVADRMFYSIPASWESVTNNPADVKELIPEFFLSNGSFLVNSERLPLGLRQTGKSVDAVELPPWANSPQDFIAKHRAALESPFVSANLHHWLDLIFGYKQRGKAAEEADNVFHHLTYEGAVDVDNMVDKQQRAALESQINEFGQCPRQLFIEPHPPRLACPAPPDPTTLQPPAGTAPSSTAGTALSLPLLTTILAATASDKPPTAVSAEESELLRELDVLHLDPTPSLSHASSSSSGVLLEGEGVDHGAGGPGGEGEGARRLPDRLRNWSGRMGGSLSAMVDTLTKGEGSTSQGGMVSPRSLPSGTAPIAQSLKGLFQRQANPPTTLPSGGLLSSRRTSSELHTSTSGKTAFPQPGVAPATDLTQRLHSHSHATTSASAAGHSDPPLENPPDPQPAMDTEGLKAALQEMIAGGAMTPAAKLGSSTSPPAGSSEMRLWGADLKQRFKGSLREIATQQGAVTAVALAAPNGDPTAYFVGHNAALKIHSLSSGAQIRSGKLGSLPLTSLSLLHNQGENQGSHPVILAGSYDNQVYAYSVEFGRQLGRWQGHDDAVSCLHLTSSTTHLLTGSWDCSVKLWQLAEGRQPWSVKTSAQPQHELTDGESGIWAVAGPHTPGGLILGGTEDGMVLAWDVRSPALAWQARASTEYVGGLAVTPDGQQAIAATGDGHLTLLDLRKAAETVAEVSCGSALLCCQTDGQAVAAGTQAGQICLWRYHQASEQATLRGAAGAVASTAVEELVSKARSACNSLALAWLPDEGSTPSSLHIVAAHEDGSVMHGIAHA